MPETTDWKQKYRDSVAEMQAEENRWAGQVIGNPTAFDVGPGSDQRNHRCGGWIHEFFLKPDHSYVLEAAILLRRVMPDATSKLWKRGPG